MHPHFFCSVIKAFKKKVNFFLNFFLKIFFYLKKSFYIYIIKGNKP